MLHKIVKHVRHAMKGPLPELCGPGPISKVLRDVHADAEVQTLAATYARDPGGDIATRLRHRAMSIIMKQTRGHMNPAIVASIVREEFPNVW